MGKSLVSCFFETQWVVSALLQRVGPDSEPDPNHDSDSFLDAVSDQDAWRFLCNSRASC